jgi:outer membrane lipoprotein-sorting protein
MRIKILLGLVAGIGLAATLQAQAPSPQLAAVLQQMDAASKTFKSARADFHCDYYERVVRDTTTQAGPIYFLRENGATQMGLVVSGPGGKVIQYKNGLMQMFDPGVNQITVLHATAGQAEGYFTLGFGGSGTDLAKAWNIKDLGPDTLTDDGHPVKTEKLDLTSKDPAARTFDHITLWMDPTRALALKQVFYMPSHDVRTCTYSNVKLNGKIDTGTFAIKKNGATTVVTH